MSDKSDSLATLASNIKKGIENYVKDLHTSMPGIIVSFDASTQLASVQPAIKRIFKTNDGEKELMTPTELPLLINVPVQFPRGGGFSLTFPVKPGDECLLVFCERSIDYWHKFGGVQEPGARRFHHLSDATAFVGLSSLVNKVPAYDPINTVIKKDDESVFIKWNADSSLSVHADNNINVTSDAEISMTAASSISIQSSTDISITAPIVSISGTDKMDLNSSGGADFSTSYVRHNGTPIDNTHVHSQGSDSNGDSEVDTDPPK